MSKIYPINIDIYNACLWVFFGTIDECADAIREQSVEERHINDWRQHFDGLKGCVGNYSYNNEANINLLWLQEVPETVGAYGTLVHEIEHFVFYLFDRLGMTHTEASDEAYAYLQGYVFRQIDDIIVTLREEQK